MEFKTLPTDLVSGMRICKSGINTDVEGKMKIHPPGYDEYMKSAQWRNIRNLMKKQA